MGLLQKVYNLFHGKKETAVTETPTPTPNPTPRKFKLTREDAGPIAKAWAVGAALAVVIYTGQFLTTQIDWGTLAAIAAMVIPPAITTVQRWLTHLQGEATSTDSNTDKDPDTQ